MRFVAALICCLLLAGCAGTDGSEPSLFDYDAGAPLDIERGDRDSTGTSVHEHLTFRASGGERLRAIYVHPRGSGPWPVVVFSPSSGGDEHEQLADAELLVRRGVASLLVSPPPALFVCEADRDLAIFVGYVVGRRRALDLVAELPGADPTRIAAVGFSWGSSVTAALAGTDHRLRGAILQSGRGHQTDWMRDECTGRLAPQQLEEYVRHLSEIDPILHVPNAEPTALLFQNGTQDSLTPKSDITPYFEAASEPKELRWYDAGHRLDEDATRYRVSWLVRALS